MFVFSFIVIWLKALNFIKHASFAPIMHNEQTSGAVKTQQYQSVTREFVSGVSKTPTRGQGRVRGVFYLFIFFFIFF